MEIGYDTLAQKNKMCLNYHDIVFQKIFILSTSSERQQVGRIFVLIPSLEK